MLDWEVSISADVRCNKDSTRAVASLCILGKFCCLMCPMVEPIEELAVCVTVTISSCCRCSPTLLLLLLLLLEEERKNCDGRNNRFDRLLTLELIVDKYFISGFLGRI